MQDIHTPCYVIDEEIFELNSRSFQNAIERAWGNCVMGYSIKTNPHPWLLSKAKEMGFYAEAVSDFEVELALRQGFDYSHIIFNGPIKSESFFTDAIVNGSVVNIDSMNEVDWLCKNADRAERAKIGIRVNVDLNEYDPTESRTGPAGSRFGFCARNGSLDKIMDRLAGLSNAEVAGLHLHVNSASRTPPVFGHLVRFAAEIADRYDLELSYVDLGGGFFGGYPDIERYDQYADQIARALRECAFSDDLRIIVEPGGAILATSISLLASVVDVKQVKDSCLAVTQASRVWLDPTMNKDSYAFEVRYAHETESVIPEQVICGFTCMDTDRLFVMRDAPLLNRGDMIEFKNVGAYSYCFNPSFFIEPPPYVYVKSGQECNLVSDRRAPWM